MSAHPLFSGCATALVTPFHQDGSLDEEALRYLVIRQREAHMDAIVLLGTTGEPSTLDMNERQRIIEIGVKEAGSMPVIVGTGANDTKKAADYARQAYDLGASGQLTVTPYYNKATQTGLIHHYETIAEAVPLPMILYNVPSRTGMCISAETAAVLTDHPAIVGLKEASGNLSLSADILQRTGGHLPLYCGNDDIIVPLMAQGAVGAISVVANLLPLQTRTLTESCITGKYGKARIIQNRLLPLIRALFSQVNPIPAKAALAAMQLCEDELRLPLTSMEEPYKAKLLEAMRSLEML